MSKLNNKLIENIVPYIIYKSSEKILDENDTREGITNLKLQKILYFVEAFSLIKNNKSAFKEKILAWQYGPVIKEVYDTYKINKNNPIISKEKPLINEEMTLIIDKVWELFGGLSASKLVDITHSQRPWIDAFNSNTKEIKRDVMIEYYKNIINK